MNKNIVTLKDYDCSVIFASYQNNNQIAMRLVAASTRNDCIIGEPIATATLCVPEFECEPEHTLIKDYNENEGVFEALIKSGHIIDTGKRLKYGDYILYYVKVVK